jgi:tetratricopeptide (TPR) repeat protein
VGLFDSKPSDRWTLKGRATKSWIDKGDALAKSGRNQKASEYYNKALEINPRFAAEWNNKGLAFAKLGRNQEAVECYNKALEMNPKLAIAWNNKAASFINVGRYQEGIEYCDNALEINPKLALAWNNKEIAFTKLGRYKEAILCNGKTLEIDPKNAKASARKSKLAELEKARKERDVQLAPVERSIIENRAYTPEQLEFIKTYPHNEVYDLYWRLYNQIVKDRELDGQDIATLINFRKATGLALSEIQFTQLIQPYSYIKSIRKEGKLPTQQLSENIKPILKRGEVVHYLCIGAVYKEATDTSKFFIDNTGIKARVRLDGSHFRLKKDVNHRAGAFAQDGVRPFEDILASWKGSTGTLFITNKRLLLQPFPGEQPVSIGLNRILSFNCVSDAIEIWQDGRKRADLFWIPDSASVEICALCLIFLLDAESKQHHQKGRSPFRSIPTEVKNRVLARDGGRCVMCGSSDGIHFDHILPVSKGGDNTEDNIQILCKDCNLRKHDKII